jgi:hypothetical protein
MGSIAIVSLVTRNYIHYAHALAISVKEHAPDAAVVVCVADDPGPDFRPPAEWDHFVLAKDLGIPHWRRFAFQYTPFELSCALKPFVVQYALERGHERIAYLDGDMQIYSNLAELRGWLDDSSIVLTPHAHFATRGPGDTYEQLFLIAGTYNAGFFAVRDSAESRRFLTWWKARVAKDGIHDLPGGYFVDQKWLDLVPGLFDGVHICKHLGYNLGHWMLGYRPNVKHEQGRVTINGDPLSIFHYSGFRAQLPELISHHEGSTVANFPALAPLCSAYAKRLKECGLAKYETLGCEFNQLTDGTTIDQVWREAIRKDHPRFAGIVDPFDVSATPDLVKRFTAVTPKLANARVVWRLNNAKRAAATATPGAPPAKPGKLRAIGKRLEHIYKGARQRGRATLAKIRLALSKDPSQKRAA